jgi:diadenosine tetraphosphatase ApaH/serine/threonine PP2A family protein phosphatase
VTEPNLIELSTTPDDPLIVCGDIHGQMLDLFQLFRSRGFVSATSPRFLFLGDYVDRGYFSFETFAFLAFLKVKFPDKIYLLRGSHESRALNRTYGLYSDCEILYGHAGMWATINDTFDYLPIAAVIDERIFCVHGGLSPRIGLVHQINSLARVREIGEGPIADFVSADPVDPPISPVRDSGWVWGREQTERFLVLNGMWRSGTTAESPDHGFVIRGRQLEREGYRWFHGDRGLTVWSAPNYLGREGNEAATVAVAVGCPLDIRKFERDERSHVRLERTTLDYFV